MVKFTKGKFEVDFGLYGKKEKDGYHSDVFFIYKTKDNWTVCHKQSNLKLSPLSNKLLSVAKDRAAKAEQAFDWNAETGFEIASINGLSGKEMTEKLWEVIT